MKMPAHSARLLTSFTCLAILLCSSTLSAQHTHRLSVEVSSKLTYKNTPLDPEIDFSPFTTKPSDRLELHSLQVINAKTRKPVPFQISPDFNYGPKGRVMWVANQPDQTKYEILFKTSTSKTTSQTTPPLNSHPPIGVGDLLRYNAQVPRPITLFYGMNLADLNQDGTSDVIGCWNYSYGPLESWNGIITYPGKTNASQNSNTILVGDRSQLRFVSENQNPSSTSKNYFSQTYQSCDIADFNGDDLPDLVQTTNQSKQAQIFLNTGQLEPNGFPIFESSLSFPVASWEACRAVDLDQNGTLEIVVNGQLYPNKNPKGWPYQPGKPTPLEAGTQPDFIDLNQDGLLDAVCLDGAESILPDGYHIAWRENLGGSPTRFGPPEKLTDLTDNWCSYLSVVQNKNQTGLLVQHNVYQEVSFYELDLNRNSTTPRFKSPKRLESNSAVLSLSDQAWPCVCDWEGDGDQDLLVGGGYGWPRIVINEGTSNHPQYSEPQLIQSEGKPIRFLRDDILGPPASWHNMGYHYPNYIDWNGDQLPDLIFPNETNRIYWYENIGSRAQPRFGPRQQILCEGFPDSDELRTLSAQRAYDKNSNNGVYPYEEERPWFWRTGAAFADWNNDGRTDFITLSSVTKQATLFTQLPPTEQTEFQVKPVGIIKLTDGRPIDDKIVNRRSHWTESFRPVDWNQDGLTDLVYSLAGSHNGIKDNGSMYLLLNEGTKQHPVFAPPQTLSCYGGPIRLTAHGPHPWVGDFDGDNQPDLLPCVEWSVYPFYRHAALMMKERPEFEITLID